jgi:hypothetical protein
LLRGVGCHVIGVLSGGFRQPLNQGYLKYTTSLPNLIRQSIKTKQVILTSLRLGIRFFTATRL